jgi:hypothetical protein
MGHPPPVEYASIGKTEPDAPTAGDDVCVRCGYDLRGVADDAPCTECGLLAERSRQRDGHLSDATPGWLRGISVGVTLALLAHLIAPAWFVLTVLAWELRTLPWAFPTLPISPAHAALLGFDLAALTLIVGVWLLTRPQHAAARDGVLRWSLRLASLGPAVALLLLHAAFQVGGFGLVTQRVAFAVMIPLTVGLAPIPALGFTLLRRLAKRVLNPNLAEHAAIVGVGLSLTLAAIPMIVGAIYALDDLPFSRRQRNALSIGLPLLGMVSFLLFGGWSLLNCVRFALAFRRAHRGASRKWRDADRSEA